ncbi:MAG: phosphoribosylglycinamide formyltransferase [Ruminococcaceae bacterium]|nr:phosphoribosylglycinamide formyltransferase [Oscillospiraceae bacterium]
MKTKITVLVSGGGTNLQALIDAQQAGILHSGEISLVISDKPGVKALERAEKAGIATAVVPRANFGKDYVGYGRELLKVLKENGSELIVLAGFLTILSDEVVAAYPEKIINVHPSLIPSFCGEGFFGLKVHDEALEYSVKVTGATVHFVSEVVDGGRIIAQKAVDILEGDTPEVLQRRVMENCEWIILPQAVEKVSAEIMNEKN